MCMHWRVFTELQGRDRRPGPEPGTGMNARWTDIDGAGPTPPAARELEAERRAAAERALEEHWALRSLRQERRAQILHAVEGLTSAPASPLPRRRRPRGSASFVVAESG